MILTRRVLLASAPALSAAGCSPLQIFDALAPQDQGAVEAASGIPYGAGPRQRLDVYVPARAPARGLPLLVFFYGGSWTSGSRQEYAFVGRAFAARGFVTVLPDYRLFPDVAYTDFLADCARAVRVARDEAARFGADGRRLALAGHSAGAYNAAMLALDRTYLGRAGVAPGAVRALVGLSGPYDFLPLDPGTAQDVFGRAPDKAATQPITFAGPGSPPSFLATGDRDKTVRPQNTNRLAARLREAGVPVEERVYPGLDHKDTLLALSVPFRERAPELAEATAFLETHTAGPRAG